MTTTAQDTPVLHDLTPAIGTEIRGLDLRRLPHDAALRAQLHQLLGRRAALFLPGQHLTPPQQRAVAEAFGTVANPGPTESATPDPDMVVFDSREDGRVPRWHSDVSALERPPAVQVLQIVQGPGVGGDTLFVSGEAAYARLSAPLRRLVDPLQAVHASVPLHAERPGRNPLRNIHPVVRVHADTGRPALFVNPRFTTEIVGLQPHESDALLQLLFEHLLRPEHVVRYRWEVGTIGIWDNRSTMHYAVDDYGDEVRINHRIGTGGERPIGL